MSSIYARRATEICERQELREWLEVRSAQRLRNLAADMPRERGVKLSKMAIVDWLLEYRPEEMRRERAKDAEG